MKTSISGKPTIWRNNSVTSKDLVASFLGFPVGTPGEGTTVDFPGYGKATCSGRSKSGFGPRARTTEIHFTLET